MIQNVYKWIQFRVHIHEHLILIEKLSAKHLVEEQDEVDGEDHKQSQKTKDVEIASQVVLQRRAKC